MTTTRLSLIALMLTLPLSALAQNELSSRTELRQARQEARIERGEASGALTPREADKLQRGQRQIDRMADRVAADGRVTDRERARLEHAQDQQSRRIAREAHDRQTDVNHDGRNDRPRFSGDWRERQDFRHETRRERVSERRDYRREHLADRREHRREAIERRHDRREHRDWHRGRG